MAKATKAATPKAYMLTEAQLEMLTKAHSLLDTASDTLNGIDGDENLYEIGKKVGQVEGVINKSKGGSVIARGNKLARSKPTRLF